MRRLALVLLAACSVPDKRPSGDAGGDAPLPTDDNAIPETTITAAPPEFAGSGTATFEFTANYANVTFQCSIDGESPVACTSPYTRVLPDGAHNFSVRAINGGGKSDETPAEHLWMIDTVAPNTMLVEAPPPADNSVMVRFVFGSSEENVTFDCSLDNGAYLPCESGQEIGPLADGSHSYAVRAHDRAGNVDSSPAIHAWSIDTSTPDTQLLSGPDGSVSSTSATFTFVSPDAGSGASFECSLDGGAMVMCVSPHTVSNVSEGEHTFAVRVRDAVGNYDPTPASRTWRVDLAAPQTTIDSGPMGMVRMASATFTFSASEPGVTFGCSLDGAAFTGCTSPHNLPSLGQGAHTFAVRATDAANHTDPTPATRSWTVDTIAPSVTIDSPAEGATTGPRVAFGFTASDGTVACSIDAGAFAPCSSPFSTNLPAGNHTFAVSATDGAGNVTTVTRAWTVACDAPSTAGAAALLHLDDNAQILANATGGPSATLGATDMDETVDPAFGPGRFASALVFAATDGDRAEWPLALGSMPAFTIEVWARADAAAGTRDLVVNSGGNIAVRVTALSPSSVRFDASVTESGGTVRTVQSAAVAAGAWHHVLVSLGSGALRLWVDGARTQMAVGPAAPTFDAVTLGGNYAGALDEVWIAQTAILDDENALARWCPL